MAPLHVVLVETIYSKNIGTSVRAMANMGADRLILVNPKCEVNSKSRQGAAGAQSRLTDRTVYSTFDEFLQNESGLFVALSRRQGKYRTPQPIEFALDQIGEQAPKPIYFIFGREDDGLSTEQIDRTHLTVALPTHGDFGSLNLAQAVLLTLFVARQKWPLKTFEKTVDEENSQLLWELDALIRQWLISMGFQLDHRQGSALKVTRKLLLQGLPETFELKIFNTILKQNIQMLQDRRRPL